MQIDITTGDAITPKEVLYLYKKIFEEGSFGVWAYNVETVLAEKVETILRRGELNTRPRDFYDVYILTKTQSIDHSIFLDALKSTAAHRGTTHIFINISNRLAEISESEALISRWSKYTRDYRYAEAITFEDIMDSMTTLVSTV
ncbi:Nucleotidyl transferase AbiEii toxin, Type IV TA system [Acidaminobacter hydrogenoformans DSM 2784]|uniref:Nucleotidyl transferase AbiEii toxin, Type IV TA system n=2 Tax=Acidaminobacter TaxID=65402 RepID=A0A1G5RWR4_9FIRM|nr:Nucleotidyl transferase AbiEii toxin, Type IV TA system [Acidaminobacter hydrogenoformans DSM 2784]